MANKNGTGKGKTAKSSKLERAEFVGYVNITLTEEDRADYEGYVGEADMLAEAHLDALDLGYQFTTKADFENDCVLCSISNWDRLSQDSGVIYTARASNPGDALSKALFVWDRKLARNLNNGAVKGTRQDAF